MYPKIPKAFGFVQFKYNNRISNIKIADPTLKEILGDY